MVGTFQLEFYFPASNSLPANGLRVIMKDFIISFVHRVLMLWLSFILPEQEDLREAAEKKNKLMNFRLDMNW